MGWRRKEKSKKSDDVSEKTDDVSEITVVEVSDDVTKHPIVNSCCGCCSLGAGSLLIAVIYMVSKSFQVLHFCIQIFFSKLYENFKNITENVWRPFEKFMCIISVNFGVWWEDIFSGWNNIKISFWISFTYCTKTTFIAVRTSFLYCFIF